MTGPPLLVGVLVICQLIVVLQGIPTLPNGQKIQAAGPDPDLKNYVRAGCDNFTGDVWQPLRPAYHVTPPYGWVNDPHGMFQLNDTVHMFFQYNPRDLAWGPPFWGHVVSKDLAHWTWLPPALLPDTQYDFNGAWSGAAAVVDDDRPVLTYTAASTDSPEAGNKWQRQAMAVPANLSDPFLKKWVKPQANPFLLQVPPGGTNFQFRDPTEGRHAVWLALTNEKNPNPLPKGHYALAVGVQAYCLGGAGIYSAPDMSGPWTYRGSLFNQLAPEPEVNGQCMANRADTALVNRTSSMGPAFGGPCDQFGARCRMWEVVDMAELEDGVFFLKWDDQSHFRELFAMEWYVLGNEWDFSAVNPDMAPAKNTSGTSRFGLQYSDYYSSTGANSSAARNGNTNVAFNELENMGQRATANLFTGKLDGQLFAPMQVDYGSVYASMVFRTADKRQVMFVWIYETAAGCKFMCSDEKPASVVRQGFKGAQSMPRQLNYDPLTKTLRAYPVEEMALLRGKQAYSASKVSLPTFPNRTLLVPVATVPNWVNGANNKLPASQVIARQFEIQANFTLSPSGNGTASKTTTNATLRAAHKLKGADWLAVSVRIEFGGGKYADAMLHGSVKDSAIDSLSLWFDKRQAGGETNTTYIEHGPVPLPADPAKAWKVPDTPLQLSVWVDHGVIEIFAMQGLGRLTSRVYPEDDSSAWGASAYAIPPESGNGWNAQLDAEVWEMQSAWLPPNC